MHGTSTHGTHGTDASDVRVLRLEDRDATLTRATGSADGRVHGWLVNDVALALSMPPHHAGLGPEDRVCAAVAAMCDIAPRDTIEGMLAAQMVAVHSAALECLRRAADPEAAERARDADLRHAARLLNVFERQMKARDDRRNPRLPRSLTGSRAPGREPAARVAPVPEDLEPASRVAPVPEDLSSDLQSAEADFRSAKAEALAQEDAPDAGPGSRPETRPSSPAATPSVPGSGPGQALCRGPMAKADAVPSEASAQEGAAEWALGTPERGSGQACPREYAEAAEREAAASPAGPRPRPVPEPVPEPVTLPTPPRPATAESEPPDDDGAW